MVVVHLTFCNHHFFKGYIFVSLFSVSITCYSFFSLSVGMFVSLMDQ